MRHLRTNGPCSLGRGRGPSATGVDGSGRKWWPPQSGHDALEGVGLVGDSGAFI
jgi:hypothetical protein